MLDRNRRIKKCPEKFQHTAERFDIIVTAEERVYDQVIEFMESKPPVHNQPVHIINIDIQDNHEEATLGAFLICDMIQMVMTTEPSSTGLLNDDSLASPFRRWHPLRIWTTRSMNCCMISRLSANDLSCIVCFSTERDQLKAIINCLIQDLCDEIVVPLISPSIFTHKLFR